MAKEITVKITKKELDLLVELINLAVIGTLPKPNKKELEILFILGSKLQMQPGGK